MTLSSIAVVRRDVLGRFTQPQILKRHKSLIVNLFVYLLKNWRLVNRIGDWMISYILFHLIILLNIYSLQSQNEYKCENCQYSLHQYFVCGELGSSDKSSNTEEIQRIKSEHPDDACAVMNDRVKGSLKVTRAFGAGFLKQPKWNDALLEEFRIDYVGKSPYINCIPSLYHHKLGPRDRFLILSSGGLYQYFTNEEAISEVELFIQWSPEGDPAQHLIEQVLFYAAKKESW
ncbi:putative protein-serine/threonine phosphatase [Helianthus annuus]|nr:putative protein-serine/threonine phosphatase [Helianthus annuus]